MVERYGVANPLLMRRLLRHCLGHPASLLSVHKLYQDLRSQGLAVSKDSLYNYLGYLEESFVVFTLPVAERSLRKRLETDSLAGRTFLDVSVPSGATLRRNLPDLCK